MFMKSRQLGYTDLNLATIGLGTWSMGGPWQYGWALQDDNASIRTILEALEQGVNWIDTAPIYGLGHSEKLLGKAIKQAAQKPIISNKCGLAWNEQQREVNSLKSNSIREQCHDSLRRLGVDVIDLYQIHWPKPNEDIEQAWEEMVKLKEEGKIRYLGVSNFSVAQIERIRKIHPVASLQSRYNMLVREIEDGLLEYCKANDIGVMAWSPMERGLLTGKFSHQRLKDLPEDDHRKTSPDFSEPKFSATLKLVDALGEIAGRNGQSCSQMAISWILHRSEITAVIVGARKPEQIAETAVASKWDMSDNDVETIQQLLTALDKENIANSI